jgi:hypothetical protein
MLHYLLENKLNSQFSDSHILNHRIIAAASVKKGSKSAQGDRNVAFFFVRQ